MKLARGVLAHSLAPSTRQGYRSAVKSVNDFCVLHGMRLTLPISSDTLCLWIAHSSTRLSHKTIRVYLHGIATTHVELGYANPLEGAGTIMRMYTGVKRLQGEGISRTRLPITVEILERLERWQDVATHDGRMLRAAMWLGTCGLLRSGEFASRGRDSVILRRADLTFVSNEGTEALTPPPLDSIVYMKLRLRQSKTDPFRRGVDVIISQRRAISVMLLYLASAPPQQEDDPLFLSLSGRELTVPVLVSGTQALLERSGSDNPQLYKGHSFRRGGATSLHLAGLPDTTIKAMGRWRSFAFAVYVDTPLTQLIEAGRALSARQGNGKTVTFGPQVWKTPVWE